MTADRFAPLGDGTAVCYRVHGDRSGTPLLLVAGLGQDLTAWPATLLDGLAAKGFRVIRFDNRDTGYSLKVRTPAPGRLRQITARPRHDAYDLADMAGDAIAVLDHLDIEAANVVGMSMGGMIAQTMAARCPQRVTSLTSVFSTTGSRTVGQPALSTMLLLAAPGARTKRQAIARHLRITRHIASPEYGIDEAAERAYIAQAWNRGAGPDTPAGTARQISAIHKSGDRTAELARITAPTLVVHGDRDRIVAPSGGLATAAAIPGARHVVISGMGHHLANQVIPQLVDLIAIHAASADTRSGDQPAESTASP